MTELLERNATASAVKNDTPRPGELFNQVRERICILHYSRSTEKTYLYWIKFFILHHHKRHPKDMGASEVIVVRKIIRGFDSKREKQHEKSVFADWIQH